MADITKKSDLRLFLTEISRRWNEGSPKFFRVLGNASLALGAIGFLPEIIDAMGIALTPKWVTIVGYIVKGAGGIGKIVARLAVKQPTSEVMPFTEKKQIQQIEKDLNIKV